MRRDKQVGVVTPKLRVPVFASSKDEAGRTDDPVCQATDSLTISCHMSLSSILNKICCLLSETSRSL